MVHSLSILLNNSCGTTAALLDQGTSRERIEYEDLGGGEWDEEPEIACRV